MATSKTYKTIMVVAEKSNAAVKVSDLAEFELEIVTAVSNALTQEKLAEEMVPEAVYEIWGTVIKVLLPHKAQQPQHTYRHVAK